MSVWHLKRRLVIGLAVFLCLQPVLATPGNATQHRAENPPAYLSGPWVYTGGPLGGLGYDVRMDPRNPDVMYVTDAYAGVFKSTNGGASWFPVNTNLPKGKGPTGDSIAIFSLTIDPNNPDRIWAGGEMNSGIYLSVNGGQSWQTVKNGVQENFLTVRGFTVEPGNSDVVYFAAEVPSFEWNGSPVTGISKNLDVTKGVVYRTTDGGQNWKRLWYGDNLARYIWINPQNHNLLYVSTGIFDREAANGDPIGMHPGGVGILRSTDAGLNWETLDEANGIDPDELFFGSLYMHPEDPQVLVAGSGNDPYSFSMNKVLGGVYITRDGGDTWTKAVDGHSFSAVEICEKHPNVWYAAARSGFFRSTTNGMSWEQVGVQNWGPTEVAAGFPIDLQCDPRDPQRVFVNAYGGGNFLTLDGGQTWQVASQGYTGALMGSVAVPSFGSGTAFASGRSGLFLTNTGGRSWSGMGYGLAHNLEAVAVAVDPMNSRHLLASMLDVGPGALVSWDGGDSWEYSPPPENSTNGESIQVFHFLPGSPTRILAGYGTMNCVPMGMNCASSTDLGLIYSDDGGITWNLSNLSNGSILSIVSAGEGNDQVTYAAVYGHGLYRSLDRGKTWSLVSANPYPPDVTPGEDLFLMSLAVNPFFPQYIYAGYFQAGIAISEDGGLTWIHASAGLPPETSIDTMIPDRSRPGVVYAGAYNGGVFYTTNGGESWISLDTGLTNRSARALALSQDGSVLYMASDGGGVFRKGNVTYQDFLPAIVRK